MPVSLSTILISTLCLFVHPSQGTPQTQSTKLPTSLSVEVGSLFTRNFELSGFGQPSATSGWSGQTPDVRIEYWRGGGTQWKRGWTFQPLDITYRDKLTADFTAKGSTFTSGSDTYLRYMFPSVRWTANKRVLTGNNGTDELRFGGSVIIRYADVNFNVNGAGFHDRNLIVFPLLNVEGEKKIGKSMSVFTRVDALPSPTGGLFIDGILDGLVALRKRDANGASTDIGLRIFMGGYDPKKAGDYANRINYSALVIRRNF